MREAECNTSTPRSNGLCPDRQLRRALGLTSRTTTTGIHPAPSIGAEEAAARRHQLCKMALPARRTQQLTERSAPTVPDGVTTPRRRAARQDSNDARGPWPPDSQSQRDRRSYLQKTRTTYEASVLTRFGPGLQSTCSKPCSPQDADHVALVPTTQRRF
uniref:Uncharacterized protein n=1 Tax=Rhipicephalus zambeziensis TaxID=60191 RepID=A0A224YKA2_9ACAR